MKLRARSARKEPSLRTKKRVSGDFSAQKPAKTMISPHQGKIFSGEHGNNVIYARSRNLRGIFADMPADFWVRIDALSEEYREAVERRSAAGYSDSGWTRSRKNNRVRWAVRGDPPSNNYFSTELSNPIGSAFADAFLETISDRDFPKRRAKARARFLAESVAAYGQVSVRRARDICSQVRAKEKHKKISYPELRIKCCGKPRWTVNGACPECKASPFPI